MKFGMHHMLNKHVRTFKQTNKEFVEFVYHVIDNTANPILKPFGLIMSILFGIISYFPVYFDIYFNRLIDEETDQK